jgi:hypothetical protein
VAGIAALAAVPAIVAAAPVPNAGLTPQQVITAALRSGAVAHQGLVQIDGRLGLPTLPVATGSAALLDESSRVRSWYASPTRWRTDVVTAGGQEQEVSTDDGVEEWSYENDRVTDLHGTAKVHLPQTSDLLPPAAARSVLAWIGPTDALSALPSRRIGGLAASGVRVVTSDARTSVARVDVYVDPSSGLPLEIDVYARGSQTPVFSSSFEEVSLQAPPDAVLSPVLSPGAQWSNQGRRDLLTYIDASGSADFPAGIGALPALSGVGEPAGIASYGVGFARVAVLQLPSRLVPRILQAVSGKAVQSSDGTHVAALNSALLQVVLVVRPDGAGFLLAGTLTPGAMADLTTAAVQQLANVRAAQ